MSNDSFDIGMIGLGVMGRNLLLNMADHGYAVTGFDRDNTKGSALESAAKSDQKVKAVISLSEMASLLKKPRKFIMLVPAGSPVDQVINDLLPLLEEGDIVIDAGNSHYTDTLRRIKSMKEKNFHFMGMGVSGGEKGARMGPCIMPGGDEQAWLNIKPILEAVAAKVDGKPCVAWMGREAAGHYVKMVHNGIEYAIMQLISETYDLLKRGLDLDNDALHALFKKWNEGELKSFLIEIAATVFMKTDDQTGNRLIDMIQDKAGSKGTGKWTSQDAMELPVPVPNIDMAVSMRELSVYKDERTEASGFYHRKMKRIRRDEEKFTRQLHDALVCATILSYAQGLAMLQKASVILNMEIPVGEVASIWQGGCIIRSSLLELFTGIFRKDPGLKNILLNKKVAALIRKREGSLRKVVQHSAVSGIPAAGFMAALSYLDAYRCERLPTNLIQAQRDLFGAHGYERIDKEGSFHSEWEGES